MTGSHRNCRGDGDGCGSGSGNWSGRSHGIGAANDVSVLSIVRGSVGKEERVRELVRRRAKRRIDVGRRRCCR